MKKINKNYYLDLRNWKIKRMTQEKYNDEQCGYNENECPCINNKHRVN
jgi:hypothetical protein